LRFLLVLFILAGNKLNQVNIAKKGEKRIKIGEKAEKREACGSLEASSSTSLG